MGDTGRVRIVVRSIAVVLALGVTWSLPVAKSVAPSTATTVRLVAEDERIIPDFTRPRIRREAQELPAGMVETERAAISVIEAYWKRHFAELSAKPYRGPRIAGGYVGNGGPSCAGQPSVAFNAFYCKPGDFLAWDENLMAAGYRQIGDSWVYLIIAHEWGHAIQARLRRGLTALSVELQADCLAGATLQGAADDGLVKVEPGDAEELRRTLAAAADDYPWTNQRDHGDAQQRISAFNTGAAKGLAACF